MFQLIQMWRDKRLAYDTATGTFIPTTPTLEQEVQGTVFADQEEAQVLATHLNSKHMPCKVETL